MISPGPQVVIVTGGSSGLGRATALAFAARGWRVGLIARGPLPLADARSEIEARGARCAVACADVADSSALAAAADRLETALGPADLWINCAGVGVYGRFHEVEEAEFDRVTAVTYLGTVNGVRVALSRMRPRGRGAILNVCSAAAFHGLPLMSSYAGAKAAVRAFTQAIQGELALEGSALKLMSVHPPAANTPFFSHASSRMGWPARPAEPVYQPEVVAQAIWQAYASGRPETKVSGTTVAFDLAVRLVPGVIAWCMSRLGVERQSSRSRAVLALAEPTLFTPSTRPLGVRGPFPARSWSVFVALDRCVLALTGRLRRAKGPARLRPTAPPVAPPLERRPGPAPLGLDAPADAA